MLKHEQETVIVYNYGDIEETGTFLFYTSKKADFKHLCDRVGESNLLNVRAGKTHWECEIPAKYWSPQRLGIVRPTKKLLVGATNDTQS